MNFHANLYSRIKNLIQRNQKAIFFILRVAIIYFCWKLLILLLGEQRIPIEERVWPWLSAGWESFNDSVRIVILNATKLWFDVFNLSSEIVNNSQLWVHGYAIVGVGNYCLAIQLWLFFVALIVSYSGKWYNKLWFSVMGVLLINIINVFRLIAVVYVAHYYPDYIQFNHDYVFNVIVYIFTFFMWMWWVNKFSDHSSKKIIGNEKE